MLILTSTKTKWLSSGWEDVMTNLLIDHVRNRDCIDHTILYCKVSWIAIRTNATKDIHGSVRADNAAGMGWEQLILAKHNLRPSPCPSRVLPDPITCYQEHLDRQAVTTAECTLNKKIIVLQPLTIIIFGKTGFISLIVNKSFITIAATNYENLSC